MSSFEICNFEEFVAEVTPQIGSLEEAGSAQEILIQQVEGYFQRMKAALCADVTNLQDQIDNLPPSGGGEVWKITERIQAATTAMKVGAPAANIDFPTAGVDDSGGDLTWDAVNFAYENTSGATLYVNVMVSIACQAVGTGRPLFLLRQDVGAGFVDIANTAFWSEVGRMSSGKLHRIDLAPGDKIAVGGYTIVGNVNMINSSVFQLLSRNTTP